MFARLASDRLLGAHFTNITTASEILIGCQYLMNHFAQGSGVQNLYFIANLVAWQGRTDRYQNTHTLLTDLKGLFGFGGQIWVFDKNIIGHSVDAKLDAVAGMSYRATPNPDPVQPQQTNDVKYVKTALNSNTPMVKDMDRIYDHKLQTDQTGWTQFVQGMMVPV